MAPSQLHDWSEGDSDVLPEQIAVRLEEIPHERLLGSSSFAVQVQMPSTSGASTSGASTSDLSLDKTRRHDGQSDVVKPVRPKPFASVRPCPPTVMPRFVYNFEVSSIPAEFSVLGDELVERVRPRRHPLYTSSLVYRSLSA